MMSTFVLQLKGDNTFSLLSQVADAESISEIWKLCTKVSAHLEQGERLENLSWRLFYLPSIDKSAGVNKTFKRLSKETGQRLDRERHLRLSQLSAPRLRTSVHAKPKTIAISSTMHHPAVVCSLASIPVQGWSADSFITCSTITTSNPLNTAPMSPYDLDFKAASFNLESFLSSFSPLALLSAVNQTSYPDGGRLQESNLTNDSQTLAYETADAYSNATTPSDLYATDDSIDQHATVETRNLNHEIIPSALPWEEPCQQTTFPKWESPPFCSFPRVTSAPSSSMMEMEGNPSRLPCAPNLSDQPFLFKDGLSGIGSQISRPCDPFSKSRSENAAPACPVLSSSCENTFVSSDHRSSHRRKRRNPMATRPPTFTGQSEMPDGIASDGSAESPTCSNCRGTQTPLWRRGPDDELLCNACGVFYKVHKKHRPHNLAKVKNTFRGKFGSRRNTRDTQPIKCTNCNATATPMWRKAPDGTLLCNACALYFKCHKRPRPMPPQDASTISTASVMAQSLTAGIGLPYPTLCSPADLQCNFSSFRDIYDRNRAAEGMSASPLDQLSYLPLF